MRSPSRYQLYDLSKSSFHPSSVHDVSRRAKQGPVELPVAGSSGTPYSGANIRERLRSGKTSLAPLISNLRDQIDLDTSSKRNLSDPKGAANMHSYFSKNLREEFRCAVSHQMLLGVRGSAIHEHHQLKDTFDLV